MNELLNIKQIRVSVLVPSTFGHVCLYTAAASRPRHRSCLHRHRFYHLGGGDEIEDKLMENEIRTRREDLKVKTGEQDHGV